MIVTGIRQRDFTEQGCTTKFRTGVSVKNKLDNWPKHGCITVFRICLKHPSLFDPFLNYDHKMFYDNDPR
jgi:hypothetical protein